MNKYEPIWEDSFNDSINGINSIDDANEIKIFINGEYTNEVPSVFKKSNDNKIEIYKEKYLRFVDKTYGYAITLKNEDIKINYELAKYGMSFENENFKLKITKETNTYSHSKEGFNIYFTEWVNRYIDNEKYLEDNNLSYYEKSIIWNDKILDNYEICIYSIVINDNQNINFPYYKIAIIKMIDDYSKFGLLVYKSNEESSEEFLNIVKSYKETKSVGTARNYIGAYENKINEKWSDETKKYYEKLKKQQSIDWGIFSASLCNDNDDNYDNTDKKINSEKNRLESEEGIDHKYEILPTYSHIAWYDYKHYFPNKLAEKYAGGNGFNELPVLQFTYQFTNNNNNVNLYNTSDNYTPMFDILRGVYDEHFTKLAKDIKKYGKPILFRLNNEMNTDWTSYCGLITLLDPDIFIKTWQHLYNIFEENNVDNAIWIFNPIYKSCPYSLWGEDLNYFPGIDYVQIFGITSYEMNNEEAIFATFKEHYSDLYNKSFEYFANYPWTISEFACGSGGETSGELYRNQDIQAKWVSDMFDEIANYANNDYLKNIKVAVWFSVNDYGTDGKIVNALELNSKLQNTLKAFRDGFKKVNIK